MPTAPLDKSVQAVNFASVRRIRVAVLDPHELVVAGLTAMLQRFDDRVDLIEQPGPDVEALLYGVREELGRSHDRELHRLLRTFSGSVIALGRSFNDPGVQLALSCGAHGFLSKQMPAKAIVSGIERYHGRNRMPTPAAEGNCHHAVDLAGLTPRERDVVALVGAGFSNPEIAGRLFVSVNSVKSYIRTAYKKIGATRRSQAVLWAERHGFVDTSLSGPAREVGPRVDSEAVLSLLTSVDASRRPARRPSSVRGSRPA